MNGMLLCSILLHYDNNYKLLDRSLGRGPGVHFWLTLSNAYYCAVMLCINMMLHAVSLPVFTKKSALLGRLCQH